MLQDFSGFPCFYIVSITDRSFCFEAANTHIKTTDCECINSKGGSLRMSEEKIKIELHYRYSLSLL